jgi:hypothetical protein
MMLYVNDKLNKDKLHFKMHNSSVIAFIILGNFVIYFLLSVLRFCEIKLLSELKWDP